MPSSALRILASAAFNSAQVGFWEIEINTLRDCADQEEIQNAGIGATRSNLYPNCNGQSWPEMRPLRADEKQPALIHFKFIGFSDFKCMIQDVMYVSIPFSLMPPPRSCNVTSAPAWRTAQPRASMSAKAAIIHDCFKMVRRDAKAVIASDDVQGALLTALLTEVLHRRTCQAR